MSRNIYYVREYILVKLDASIASCYRNFCLCFLLSDKHSMSKFFRMKFVHNKKPHAKKILNIFAMIFHSKGKWRQRRRRRWTDIMGINIHLLNLVEQFQVFEWRNAQINSLEMKPNNFFASMIIRKSKSRISFHGIWNCECAKTCDSFYSFFFFTIILLFFSSNVVYYSKHPHTFYA